METDLIISNNIIFNNLAEASAKPQETLERHVRSGVTTLFCVTSSPDGPLTEFDLATLSVLHTIYADRGERADFWTFSPSEVCQKLIPGASGSASKKLREAVIKSIDRLRDLTVQINCKDEFNLHRKEFLATHSEVDPAASWHDITGVAWPQENSLLSLEKEEKVIKGGFWGEKKEILYIGNRPPLLYTFSQVTNQFVTLPADILNIRKTNDQGELGDSLPMTINRISMAFRMARDVARISYRYDHPEKFDKSSHGRRSHKKKRAPFSPGKKENPVILLSTLFDRCGMDEAAARRHLKDHLNFIRAAMDCWAAQGLIPAWDFRDRNQASRKRRTCVDAIRFYPGTVSSQQQKAEEAAAAQAVAMAIEYIPHEDPTFGGNHPTFGGNHPTFGGNLRLPADEKTAQPSWLAAIVSAVLQALRYSKYSIPSTPVTP